MQIAKRFVLIGDDDPSITLALKRQLDGWAKERGLEILMAASGRAGLETIETHGEDIIIVVSDLNMPEIKGSDFLAAAKTKKPGMVSILLIGFSGTQEIAKAVGAGIFSFVLKPWEPEYLVAELQKAFEFGESRINNAFYLKKMDEELKWAGALQKAILKPNLPSSTGVEFKVSYHPVPALYCGGDYYDVILLEPERYLLLTGDVEGHGVKAAFVTGILKAIIYSEYVRAVVGKNFSPGAFLSWLNQRLHYEFRFASSMLLTLFAGVLALRSGIFRYSNAGHNHPFVLRAGRAIELPVSGSAIDFSSSMLYTEQTIEVKGSDVLVLFTDGLIEIDCSEGCAPLKPGPILERIEYGADHHRKLLEAALAESGSVSFSDDVTIVTAKIL